jgi:hypothetical protein
VTAPDFIIGGAPRSGTTALARALDAHPSVTMAKPLIPEPKVLLGDGDPLEAYDRLFAAAAPGQVLGEKTSNLLEDEQVPGAVATLLPQVRMVFTLRHPVDRAYSNWLWSRLNGYEDLDFEDAVAREGERPDPPQLRPGARPFAYLARSRYGEHARRWIEALGRERLHFVLFETLTGPDAARALARVQAFIGVDERDLGALPTGSGNEAADTGPPLDPEVRERVTALLAQDTQALVRLTGIDVTPWRP